MRIGEEEEVELRGAHGFNGLTASSTLFVNIKEVFVFYSKSSAKRRILIVVTLVAPSSHPRFPVALKIPLVEWNWRRNNWMNSTSLLCSSAPPKPKFVYTLHSFELWCVKRVSVHFASSKCNFMRNPSPTD